MSQNPLEIRQIPVLRDNYVYLARDPQTGECAVVDPAVAGPVLNVLDQLGWRLTFILNTHHHHDHVGGNLELKRETGCSIIGNADDAARIPGIDIRVREGEQIKVGEAVAEVLDVSGHTRGHIAYWFSGSQAVFCGDTLFSLGCGRLFEGSPSQMWSSLQKLRSLPGETKVYCAHEYTENNAAFALTIDPENPDLQTRAEDVRQLRRRGQATVPSTIAMECATNPFLRADKSRFHSALGLSGLDATTVFAEIRRRKDTF